MAPSKPIAIVPLRELTSEQRGAAAALVRAAVPIYFAPLDNDEADRIIAAEIDDPRTELECGQAAILDGEVAGIVCVYPTEELPERQFNSFQHAIRALSPASVPAFVANLREIREGLPAIEGDGVYLAFIAAAEEMRGSGLSVTLMEHAVRSAGPRPLFLMVHLDNQRARSFYRKQNFEDVAEGHAFALLRRPAD